MVNKKPYVAPVCDVISLYDEGYGSPVCAVSFWNDGHGGGSTPVINPGDDPLPDGDANEWNWDNLSWD